MFTLRGLLVPAILIGTVVLLSANGPDPGTGAYEDLYRERLGSLIRAMEKVEDQVAALDMTNDKDRQAALSALNEARTAMKAADPWLRYLEPNAHKLINGPLPVEWETEVFEKHERPYRRVGAGLALAAGALEEGASTADIAGLVTAGRIAAQGCLHDSTMRSLRGPDHFHYCNRLFLLNLAAIYTTGFECPDTTRIIPELEGMLVAVDAMYDAFSRSFPKDAMPDAYREGYRRMIGFVHAQPRDYSAFDHFGFIRDHVDPLFSIQQALIRERRPARTGYMDHVLNDDADAIFSKELYTGQVTKGVFRRVDDEKELARIDALGRSLFADPILSGNGQRSCASCHRPDQCFTDTTVATAERFDHRGRLPRNTPSLVNTPLNHLLMHDGLHIDPQSQARAVITASDEMGGDADVIVERVMHCPDYARELEHLLKLTPQYERVTLDHLIAAITYHYGGLSAALSPFDRMMRREAAPDEHVRAGFNLFMSRAQCATCHFVPHFNGVKPPYIGSEFEVLGTPADPQYKALDADSGRATVNPAPETVRAFRTATLRNITRTAPYMHHGAFRTLDEVIELYNGGGGAGRGLHVPNQTLSADSLKLSSADKRHLELFMQALAEDLPTYRLPDRLPRSKDAGWDKRMPGGLY